MTESLLLAVRVVVSLAVVLALLWFIARRFSRAGVVSRGVRVEVLARQNLSRHSGVALVAVEGRRFLLGTGDMGVSLIQELSPEPGSDADLVRWGTDVEDTDTPSSAGSHWRRVWEETAGEGIQGSPAEFPEPADAPESAGAPAPRAEKGQPSRKDLTTEGGSSVLAGSILSPRTWARAWQAVRPGEGR
jgi:Flagellar biosynthesis protein, FliO.